MQWFQENSTVCSIYVDSVEEWKIYSPLKQNWIAFLEERRFKTLMYPDARISDEFKLLSLITHLFSK